MKAKALRRIINDQTHFTSYADSYFWLMKKLCARLINFNELQRRAARTFASQLTNDRQ